MAFEVLLQQHSGEITILFLSTLVLVTLLILVPQLLRAQHHAKSVHSAAAPSMQEFGVFVHLKLASDKAIVPVGQLALGATFRQRQGPH